MFLKWLGVASLSVLASAAVQSFAHAASCNPGDVCGTQTIQDFYFGGQNTFNGQDVIGPSQVFGVTSAAVTLDVTANQLTVVVNTNFAGAPASSNPNIMAALLGQSYGSLFLGPGGAGSIWLANHPTPPGPGNTYPTDQYHPGEWTAAVNMNGSGNTGAAGVYTVGGTQTPVFNPSFPGAPVAFNTTGGGHNFGQVIMSNEFGNPVTFPNPGGTTYFRQGQAVQFTPDSSASTITGTASSSFAISPTVWDASGHVLTEGSITYTIADFSALDLGGVIALSWTMSCANDVIQGVVDFTPIIPGGGGEVPIPASLSLFAAGLAVLGFVGFRRKARRLNALAT
jgi:hypothetical protein